MAVHLLGSWLTRLLSIGIGLEAVNLLLSLGNVL